LPILLLPANVGEGGDDDGDDEKEEDVDDGDDEKEEDVDDGNKAKHSSELAFLILFFGGGENSLMLCS
jgi:hypothetical protein